MQTSQSAATASESSGKSTGDEAPISHGANSHQKKPRVGLGAGQQRTSAPAQPLPDAQELVSRFYLLVVTMYIVKN